MLAFLKRHPAACVCTLLVVLTLLVFWQVRNFDFVNFDDNDYVYQNQHVLAGLSWDNIVWAFANPVSNHWHPLTIISLMLNCHFSRSPGWMHLTNVLLHLASSLLLFALLKRTTGSIWPSAFVAAAFVIHPMHVESVAWITERKDVLSTLFFLLTLTAWCSYVKKPSALRYLASLVFFALGLLSKAMLVTLPFVLILLDYWPLARLPQESIDTSRSRSPLAHLFGLIVEKIPFFILSILSAVMAWLAQHTGHGIISTKAVSLSDRFANALLSYAVYIGKMFYPAGMAPFYPLHAAAIPLWHSILYGLLLAAITFIAIRFGRKSKFLPVGWLWFLGTPIPVIGFVLVGGCAYADRYTYIPYIGLFIMLAWGLPDLLAGWRYQKHALGISAAIVLCAMAILAHRQAGYWKDSITLFSHAIDVTKKNYIAHYDRGLAYSELGQWPAAMQDLNATISIMPVYADAYDGRGLAWSAMGNKTEAIRDFDTAIKLKPGSSDAYTNRGIVYRDLGRSQDAMDDFNKALALRPDNAYTHYSLAILLRRQGKLDDALAHYQDAVRMDPTLPGARLDLGLMMLQRKDYHAAIANFKEAIALAPDMPQAYVGLATALTDTGKHDEALPLFRKAAAIDPNFADADKFFGKTDVPGSPL
jgi:protein O-mannosyl-transferase